MKFNFFSSLRTMISEFRVAMHAAMHPELYRRAYSCCCVICFGKIITRPVQNSPWRLQKACSICATPYGPSWNRLIWGSHPSKRARKIIEMYDWSCKSTAMIWRNVIACYNLFRKAATMGRARRMAWSKVFRKAAATVWALSLSVIYFLLALLAMLL